MTFFTFQRLIHAHSTLFVLQVKTISTLVKLNTFCVFLSGSSKSYAFICQFLQKSSNKSHFGLPHSALDHCASRILLDQRF